MIAMAPEVHGLQVILDLKIWSVPTKTGVPYNFCLI
jgi:hypothetical protein